MITRGVGAAPTRRPGLRLVLTGLALVVLVPVLCFVVVVAALAVLGDGPRHTVDGPPAAVLMGVVVVGVLSVAGGALLLVAGLVVLAASRSRTNAEAHARLRLARDRATTAGEARALQSTAVPGRGWRRGLPVAPVAGPLALALLADTAGLDTLARVAAFAAVPGAGWVAYRLVRRHRAVRADLLRHGLRGRDDVDDQGAIERRAAAMAAFAAARRLPHEDGQVRGTLDGVAFTLSDRIAVVTSQAGDRPVRTHVTSADTTVAVPFPTVIGLAVTPDRPEATLRWSYLGPQVDLESADFNTTYNVYCDDPVRARLVLNPAVMAALLDWPQPLQLVLAAGELRLTTPDTLTPPDRLDALVALAVRIERSARAAAV